MLGDGITMFITVNLDKTMIGTYILTYNATDASGNKVKVKNRTANRIHYIESALPEITLNDGELFRYDKGHVYIYLGATAVDSNGNNISSKIMVSDNIDINSIGYYQVNNNINDDTNNTSAQAIRTVYVVSIAHCQGGK